MSNTRRVGCVTAMVLAMGGCAKSPSRGADVSANSPGRLPSAEASSSQVVHCGNLGIRYGVVFCAHPLTDEEASHREIYFDVTLRSGRVERMDRRAGAGEAIQANTGMAWTEFRYRGSEVERTARRADGTVAFRVLVEQGGRRRRWVDESGHPWMMKGEQGNVAAYELDEAGRDVVERLLREDGSPRVGSQGAYVWRYAYDEAGKTVEERAYDASDRPVLTNEGWHAHRRAYDARGCESNETYLGTDGRLIVPSGGVAEYRVECDRWGNRAAVHYFGVNGEPVTKNGARGRRWTRDEHGRIVADVPEPPVDDSR